MLRVRPLVNRVGIVRNVRQFPNKRFSGTYPNPEPTAFELLHDRWKRQKIYLRGAMIRRRMIKLPFSKEATVISYSDMAGHSAFVCLAASYMATDIEVLRMSAVSGITLSIIFQYYREKPLWIPIRWNALFAITNIVLLTLLFLEKNDAENLPQEQKQLFQTLFKDAGNMKMEDMLHLMMIANREEYKPGSTLITAGKRRNHVYLVLQGKCNVIGKTGEVVGSIGSYEFISEQSFITWQNKFGKNLPAPPKPPKRTQRFRFGQDKDKDMHLGSNAAHHLVNTSGSSSAASNGLERGAVEVTTDLIANAAEAVVATTEQAITDVQDGFDAVAYSVSEVPYIHGLFNWMFPSDSTNDDANTDGTASAPGTAQQALVIEEEDRYKHIQDDTPQSDWLVGKVSLVVDEPTVVYSWKFCTLHEMILRRPSIGIVFERLISSNMNRKMLDNDKHAAYRNYKQLLIIPLQQGDKVTSQKKAYLAQYRKDYGITDEQHAILVDSMGWSLEDFEKGYQCKEDEYCIQYRDMMKKFLAEGVITNKQKHQLRKYRRDHSVHADNHERYLGQLHWSADEYEQGYLESYIPPLPADMEAMLLRVNDEETVIGNETDSSVSSNGDITPSTSTAAVDDLTPPTVHRRRRPVIEFLQSMYTYATNQGNINSSAVTSADNNINYSGGTTDSLPTNDSSASSITGSVATDEPGGIYSPLAALVAQAHVSSSGDITPSTSAAAVDDLTPPTVHRRRRPVIEFLRSMYTYATNQGNINSGIPHIPVMAMSTGNSNSSSSGSAVTSADNNITSSSGNTDSPPTNDSSASSTTGSVATAANVSPHIDERGGIYSPLAALVAQAHQHSSNQQASKSAGSAVVDNSINSASTADSQTSTKPE